VFPLPYRGSADQTLYACSSAGRTRSSILSCTPTVRGYSSLR
jgi:hypothetical protein